MEGAGAVAWVFLDGPSVLTQIYYGTAAYFQAFGGGFCQGDGAVETLTGSVTGLLDLTHSATVHFAGASASAGFGGNNDFTLERARDITSDLLAIQSTFTTGAAVSGLRQNDLNPVDMQSLGVLDFSGAWAMASGSVTINNLGGDVAIHTVTMFNTDRGLSGVIESPFNPTATNPRPFGSVPTSQQMTGDVHQLSVNAVSGLGALDGRTASIAFQDGTAAQTVTLGPALNPVTLSTVTPAPPAQGLPPSRTSGSAPNTPCRRSTRTSSP
jgi:hypothetical protein